MIGESTQLVSRCSRGHEESHRHRMSQFQIPMLIHISQTRRPWLGRQLTKRQAARKPNDRQLANSHVFVPVAIETAGTWNHLAVELTQELGRTITAVTDDPRETGFLFQRLSVAQQRGMRSSSAALSPTPLWSLCLHYNIFCLLTLCWWAKK